MANNKCPICGKPDIPDYLAQNVICECCGSDLSIYRLIDGIKKEEGASSSSTWKIRILPYSLAVIFAVIAIVACIAFGRIREEVSVSETRLTELEEENAALIEQNQELLTASVPAGNKPKSTGFVYTVRNGDSFWRISQKFYGTGTRFQEIAERNGLTTNAQLKVGDTLTIY